MLRRHKNQVVLLWAIFLFFLIVGITHSVRYSGHHKRLSNLRSVASDSAAADLPLYGRSAFDVVFSKKENAGYSYDVPFPFKKYLERLQSYTGQNLNDSETGGIVATLFPMGRSLQRDAAIRGEPSPANPDLYFRYPRIVAGVDGETAGTSALQLNLKNRFYTGYNEKAEALEIISYNEQLGRFEYQIVNDYAAGKTPKVRYAPRSLCLSCHQNQAPLFAKAPWKESNANPAVAAELARVLGRDHYQNIQIATDQSLTTRVDTSTDQANLLPVYQKIWKELCTTPECKKNVVLGILQLRLNRSHLYSANSSLHEWIKSFEADWQKKWPEGLSILSADIPDRDPFRDVAEAGGALIAEELKNLFSPVTEQLAHSKIPPEFEPLLPREPSEVWANSGVDAVHGNRLIKGLSKEFTQADIRQIDSWLAIHPDNILVSKLKSLCRAEKAGAAVSIDCAPSPENNFSFSVLIQPQSSTASVGKFTLVSEGETLTATGLTAHIVPQATHEKNKILISLKSKEQIVLRTSKGYALSQISIDLISGEAELQLIDQAQGLAQLTEAMAAVPAGSDRAFSRFAAMKSFYTFSNNNIFIEDIERKDLPVGVDNDILPDPVNSQHPGFNLIKNNCRDCHRNNEGSPPNFLGERNEDSSDYDLCRRIEICAPRMLYRLKMRLCNATDIKNKKTPMPPDFFLSNHKISRDKWMTDYNPKILSFLNQLVSENELARDIQTSGVTQSEAMQLSHDVLSDKCPDSSSIMYDRLPKCEFDELKAASRCR